MNKKLVIFLAPLAAVVALTAADKPEPVAAGAKPVPVDDDMHHLMEYVFEPAYKRLKKAVAAEPADKAGWSAIKEDSLTLAESTNLLLHRLPDEDPAEWIKLAVATRKTGGDVYQAARKKDYATVKKGYKLMLKSCNACHDKFADGEHQLEP